MKIIETFIPSQINMSFYAKKVLKIHLALKDFRHIFWGAAKPAIFMTESKTVTRFLQTTMIPPPLCNACDFVLKFNFVIAHNTGKMNTAADFISRLEADPNEKTVLEMREAITVKPIEVNMESAGITPGKSVFHTDDDMTEIPEKETSQRKADVRNTTSSQSPVITIASCYYTDLPKEPSIIDMAQFNKPSRLHIEQNSDPSL